MLVRAIDLIRTSGKSQPYVSAETKRGNLIKNQDRKYDTSDPVNKNWLIKNGIREKNGILIIDSLLLAKAEKKKQPKPKPGSGQTKVKKKPKAKPKEELKSEQNKSQSEAQILIESVSEAIEKIFPGSENKIMLVKNEIFNIAKQKLEKREIEKTPEYLKANKKMSKFLIAQFARVAEVEEIGIPQKENEQLRFVTSSQINVISFLLYLIEKEGNIDECIMSYYVIGIKTVELLDTLLNSGKIKKLFIQTSTIRLGEKDKKAIEAIKGMIAKYGKNRIKCNMSWIHTKILCCRIKDKYYVIEGSGNLSDNARIEQYLFERSKKSYCFHKDWIENVSELSTEKDVVIL